jgi:hypothetical protein
MTQINRPLHIFILSGTMVLSTGGVTVAATPYCDEIKQSDIIEQLSGQFDFHGANITYRSQDENIGGGEVYRYRYCIQNTHPYMPIAVQWKDQNRWLNRCI